MNRWIILLFFLGFGGIVNAQWQFGIEAGISNSINRFDETLDSGNSMSPRTLNSSFFQFHLKYQSSKYLAFGLHGMIQKQNAGVNYNQEYYSNAKITAPFYQGSGYGTPMRHEFAYNHYFMLGPEVSFYLPVHPVIEFEFSLSSLFYDNRQDNESTGKLIQKTNVNYYYTSWHNYIYLYRSETSFLNGWNAKMNGAFRINIRPHGNDTHRISLGASFGRCLKKNYTVLFHTNKPNTETENNTVKASNYGEYFGLSLGYSYTLNFK